MERTTPNRDSRITELMQQVGLSASMRERRPHQLSGGQQQRVALARAMARQPKIMLLDEPFSALDTGLREAMRDMVGDVLSDAGITTILVTHDQAEALSFADHLAVMRDGVVVQAGSPQDLYLRPTDAQTARFLGDAIILQAVLDDGGAHTILGRIPTTPGNRRGNAMVMLRPEQLQLDLNGAGAAGGSRGRILARSFRGSAWRLSIEHQPINANLDLPDSVLETSSIFTIETPGVTACAVGDVVAISVRGPAHILG
jgi:iron(III) transport system ATP-binding protein